jgi:phage tail sheath gpL-like
VTGPTPKTVVDDKSAAAVAKAAAKETVVHEQTIEDGVVVSTGAVSAEVGVTVEFTGAPGVEIRVRPEDLPEESRPKTSTDTGPIPLREGPSVKVVGAPSSDGPQPASTAEGK